MIKILAAFETCLKRILHIFLFIIIVHHWKCAKKIIRPPMIWSIYIYKGGHQSCIMIALYFQIPSNRSLAIKLLISWLLSKLSIWEEKKLINHQIILPFKCWKVDNYKYIDSLLTNMDWIHIQWQGQQMSKSYAKIIVNKTFAHMWDLKLHYTSTVIHHRLKKRFPSVRLSPASLKSEDFGTNFLYVEEHLTQIGISTAETSSQVYQIESLKSDSIPALQTQIDLFNGNI